MANLYRYRSEMTHPSPPWDDDGRPLEFCVFDCGHKCKAWLLADSEAERDAKLGKAVREAVRKVLCKTDDSVLRLATNLGNNIILKAIADALDAEAVPPAVEPTGDKSLPVEKPRRECGECINFGAWECRSELDKNAACDDFKPKSTAEQPKVAP